MLMRPVASSAVASDPFEYNQVVLGRPLALDLAQVAVELGLGVVNLAAGREVVGDRHRVELEGPALEDVQRDRVGSVGIERVGV